MEKSDQQVMERSQRVECDFAEGQSREAQVDYASLIRKCIKRRKVSGSYEETFPRAMRLLARSRVYRGTFDDQPTKARARLTLKLVT
ncbi:hypothetical protein N7501_012025 [Penicillium viridicatum]|nr:hypothetical protein N7501_012025 [Penicillium viridicatum]